MNRHAKRNTQTHQDQAATAAIIRFPRTISDQGSRRGGDRPSLVLNILLVLLLVLACVVWEAMSERDAGDHKPRHSRVAAPSVAIV